MLRLSSGKFVVLLGPDWGTAIVTRSGARKQMPKPDKHYLGMIGFIILLSSRTVWGGGLGARLIAGPHPRARPALNGSDAGQHAAAYLATIWPSEASPRTKWGAGWVGLAAPKKGWQ